MPALKSDVYLLLVGDGPERVKLERQVRESGVAERVIFTGYQPDPRPFLAVMDLFVLPSRSEGLSVALLEAMGEGIPVAVTDAGESQSVIGQGQAGLVLSDDEREWPAQLADAWRDPERRKAVCLVARARVKAHYSMEATLEGYELLYTGVGFP